MSDKGGEVKRHLLKVERGRWASVSLCVRILVYVCALPFFGHRHGHLRGVMHTVQHANRMSLNIKWDRVTNAQEHIMQMRAKYSEKASSELWSDGQVNWMCCEIRVCQL